MPSSVPVIAIYASSHGFGHAVRCATLCRALRTLAPAVRIVVRTGAPAWIFPPDVDVQPCVLDVGVIQPNSLEIDPRATLARYTAHVSDEDARIDEEAALLRALGARAAVADVPSAAFPAATRANIPGIGLANFSWDWIYEPFVAEAPEYGRLLERLRGQYGQASLLLRLPFHGDLGAFPAVEDVPLIARRAQADRMETRRRLGLPLGVPLVLFSFGGHANAGPDAARLAALDGYAFVATAPGRPSPPAPGRAGRPSPPDPLSRKREREGTLVRAVQRGRNLFLVPPLTDEYVDLLAASDVVVTKPGYGIVADLIANRVPALYVSRGGFREEPVLVRALDTEARALPLDRAALDALDLGPALAQLDRLDRPWTARRLDGAEVAARRILEVAGLHA